MCDSRALKTLKLGAGVVGAPVAFEGRSIKTILEVLDDVEEPEKERSLLND